MVKFIRKFESMSSGVEILIVKEIPRRLFGQITESNKVFVLILSMVENKNVT